MNLKVGKSYKLFFGKNNPNNKLIHIRGIIDEEYIVYWWYSRHRKRRMYDVHHQSYFNIMEQYMKPK